MSKYDELKRYLEVMTGPALVGSAEILELIAENERLSSENKQREICEAKLIAGGDSLNREADNLLARLLAVIAERNQLRELLMRLVDLQNSGRGPIRSYELWNDVVNEARPLLGLEVRHV